MLRKFSASGSRWERILPESEERIEKFVDTAENEPRQKCEFFDEISNKETKLTCPDHKYARSAPIGLRFGRLFE